MRLRFLRKAFLFAAIATLQVFAYSEAGFNFGNIEAPSYERYILEGKDPDGKKTKYVIEYFVRENPSTKAKSWEIASSQESVGSRVDNTITIRLSDLQPSYLKSIRAFNEGSFTETFDLGNDFIPNDDPKSIVFANTQVLLYILRTFPFGSTTKEIHVRSFGHRAGNFKLIIKNNGIRDLKLKTGEACSAYEIELGIDIPFWSAFIPKTYYYYRNDPQKTFVRFKGAFMPGGKEMEMELTSYTKK